MAPSARIISLKVADHAGATDVSQVLAAIDWVVRHWPAVVHDDVALSPTKLGIPSTDRR